MASLYANENFPLRVVEALRRLGHDVLTTREASQDNQRIADDDVLGFASDSGRAVITINRRDFIRLNRQQPNHRGIIVCTEDVDIEGQARRIHEVISTLQTLDGLLIRLNQPSL